MRLSRFCLLSVPALALSLAAGGTAFAQSGQTPTPAPSVVAPSAAAPTPVHQHTHMTLNQRFAQANTTNDGHLTLAQAKAGLPSVARHFAAIDKDNKGYVTLDEIHAYNKEQRAMRHQTQSNG